MSVKTLLLAILLGTAAAGHVHAETYALDPSHTAVTWHVSHFGFSHPSGKFMNIDGTLEFDQANPAASSVKVVIPIDKGQSGVAALDEHLGKEEFFDTKKYPTASFVSTKVEPTGKDTAKVTGNLTLKGVTKPVILDVKLNGVGKNPMNKQVAGFSATTVIKRSDFGMTAYAPGLGDDIRLDIESEANPVAEATSTAK